MIVLPSYNGPGVYCIENTSKNRKYIGSSGRIRSRVSSHVSQLKHGNHPIKDLQNDFNNGDPFTVSIICVSDSVLDARKEEYKRIIETKSNLNGYNRACLKPYACFLDENKEKSAREIKKFFNKLDIPAPCSADILKLLKESSYNMCAPFGSARAFSVLENIKKIAGILGYDFIIKFEKKTDSKKPGNLEK